jgi:methylenetetrahydrofolate dehydrogenase (NADP+)/methenyltetrahydrofolate cyclohydrolase
MTHSIDGRKIKDQILAEVKTEVEKLSFSPVFCDILVGDDLVSASYVRMKGKWAESVGIKFRRAEFPKSITTADLIHEIENLNRVPHMCGIIVQLPLPPHIDKQTVLDAISPALDVDCLGGVNSQKLTFPTALACMKVLDSLKLDLSNKNIVVLGQGKLVGVPVTHLLENRGVSVTTITRETSNSLELIKNADIIISAIGSGNFIKGNMIKEGVIIIDAGTSEENGGVIGDVDFDSVKSIASAISPTPGGVGPVTVAFLLKNVVEVAKGKN